MEHLAMEHPEKKVGPYTLVNKIGDGGMAEVFMARMQGAGSFEKTIALKKILPNLASNPKFRGNFINEARICGELQHHNIVQVYNFYQDGNDLYLAMEYIDGISLDAVFKYCRETETALTSDLICTIMLQVLDGLAYAHSAMSSETQKPLDIIHRDLKPSNILIDGGGVVKIVDFGVAKAANRQYETMEMTAKGTASYMAPEQILGEQPVSQRSDLFAVGAIFYELITLERLFDGENVWAILKQVATMDIDEHLGQAITGAERKFLPILKKALAREPADRFQSASELRKDLVQLNIPAAGSRKLVDLMRKIRNLDEELEDAATRLVTMSEIKHDADQPGRSGVSLGVAVQGPAHTDDEDEEENETVLGGAASELLSARNLGRSELEVTDPTLPSFTPPETESLSAPVVQRAAAPPGSRGEMPSIAGGSSSPTFSGTTQPGTQQSSASQAGAQSRQRPPSSPTVQTPGSGPHPPNQFLQQSPRFTLPETNNALSSSSTLPSLVIGAAVGIAILAIIYFLG